MKKKIACARPLDGGTKAPARRFLAVLAVLGLAVLGLCVSGFTARAATPAAPAAPTVPGGALAAPVGPLGPGAISLPALAAAVAPTSIGALATLASLVNYHVPLVTSWQLAAPGILAYDVGEGDEIYTAMMDSPHVLQIDINIYNNYVTGIDHMIDQLAFLMAEQIGVIGTFMDAKNQMETQRLLQDLDARAHKDYEPSTQMCIIGTVTRSLAMSEQKGHANAAIMANAMLTRTLMPAGQETNIGPEGDLISRMEQYVRVYCNKRDNGNSLEPLCETSAPQAQRNRDIDYTGVVDQPLTVDVDFTDAALSHDEEDVLAMSRNLYGSDLVTYGPEDLLKAGPVENMGPALWRFQNARSLQAIRGVAENSFAHIVGMKSKGGAFVYPFASQIMKELGVADADLETFLGANPSYFAQMDVLTKRIFMAPDFYTNLFTQPANVARLGATLQAIKLMNDRDRFEASLRREMLISLIVEMKIRDQERAVDNSLLGTVPNIYVK